jgi:hypothetical protein
MVVAGEYGYIVFFNLITKLKIRAGHLNTQGFGLIGAGNNATVVVAEYNNRLP